MKQYFIHTSGCQMNEHDSERIAAILQNHGFIPAGNIDEARLIIINTCSVRQKPQDKVYNLLTQLKHRKKQQKDLVIAVTGCVAQQKGQSLIEQFPVVDLVIGPDEIDNIFDYYSRIRDTGDHVVATEFLEKISYDKTLVTGISYSLSSAFVTVMKGCNSYCSYCIVPYVRGAERSRPMNEIIDDVKKLIDDGITTITLLGQNISRYGMENGETLSSLLRKLGTLQGLKRLSFMTSHPKDFSLDVLRCYEELDVLVPYLHLPAQHGSNKILKAMNRGYTREDYLKIVDAVNASKVADRLALTTDVIIGFPGEEDEDYKDLMSLLRYARFDNSFSFIYSPRPGTAAYKKYGDKEDSSKREIYVERLMSYQDEQRNIAMQKNKELEGKVITIQVTGVSRKDDSRMSGRTDGGKVVNFEPVQGAEPKVGSYIKVRIEKAYPTHMFAMVVIL
jgi:tRNA-2-methylthio-N6-dimethylallyladenosine synthase